MRSGRLGLLVCLTLAAAGCGSSSSGGGDKTFDDDKFGVSFDYPSEMKKAKDVNVGQSAGADPKATAGVAFDKQNGIFVQRYAITRKVGKGDLGVVKPEFDRLFQQAFGKTPVGKEVGFGGLPGLEYSFSVPQPENGRSRFVVVFDGATEYTINCQSTPKRRGDVEDACRTALGSLKRRG